MAKHPSDVLDTKPGTERVVLRAYPKAVVYYPSMLMAFICALWMWFAPTIEVPVAPNAATVENPATEPGATDPGATKPETAAPDAPLTKTIPNPLPGRVFFLIFFFNTLTIAFDFTRVLFIAMCLFFGLLVTIGFLMESKQIPVFKALKNVFALFDLTANPGLLLAYGVMFTIIFAGVFIQTRFNYWEVKHNELLHYHGIAGDVERYPSPSLRMSKEITDVFEYVLLFSGRLVLYPASAERPIVLDHVVRINAMEKRIEKMLQTLQVSIEGKHHHPPTQ